MSAPLKRIPVVVDLPVNTPKLGFEKYVEALAAAVLGGTPARYNARLKNAYDVLSGRGLRTHLIDVFTMQRTPSLVLLAV